MATEENEPGLPGETADEEYVDVEEDLEPGEEEGFTTRVREKLGEAKEKYVDWHTIDEPKQDQGVAATNLNRRGVLSGIAQLGAAGFIAAEATDGDGLAVDWSSGEGGNGFQGPAGGGETPAGGGAAPAGDSQNYAFETEQELIDETGFCFPGEADTYIGAIDASEVENTLEESGYTGSDPSGALTQEEVDMGLGDITPHQGLYAVDVDRRQGSDGDYDMFVQLVGEEDGGLYVTKEGAQEVSDMQFEEVFEGYQECN